MANIINDSQIVILLNASTTSEEVSDAVNRALYNNHALQVVSAGAGAIVVEGSLDGTNFVALSVSPAAANAITQLVGHYNWIRVKKDASVDEVTAILASYSDTFTN